MCAPITLCMCRKMSSVFAISVSTARALELVSSLIVVSAAACSVVEMLLYGGVDTVPSEELTIVPCVAAPRFQLWCLV